MRRATSDLVLSHLVALVCGRMCVWFASLWLLAVWLAMVVYVAWLSVDCTVT